MDRQSCFFVGTLLLLLVDGVSSAAGYVASGNSAVGATDSVVVGGLTHSASGVASAIVGGDSNTAGGYASFIGGGELNSIDTAGYYSVVGGGQNNKVVNLCGSIVGGAYNTANSKWSSIGGGQNNYANGEVSNHCGVDANAFLTCLHSDFLFVVVPCGSEHCHHWRLLQHGRRLGILRRWWRLQFGPSG